MARQALTVVVASIVGSATAAPPRNTEIAARSTRFIVTRIMTSPLTCRPIFYWDEAGLVLFVIFVTESQKS
jgi:hypothetical protein